MSKGAAFDSASDIALLLIRLVVGGSLLIFHGWGKITGGPERWHSLGTEMGNLGVTFLPVFWGFMGAFAESGGAVLAALGLLFRPSAFLVAFTMAVAVVHHMTLPPGDPSAGWKAASHALELCAVYTGLLLSGPGRYRLVPSD